MRGTINNPKHWPKDPPPAPAQLKAFDKTLPAYGPNSNPRTLPSRKERDGMRVAMGLTNAAALAVGEPMGIRALL